MVTSTRSAIPAGTRVQNVYNLAAFGIHFTTPGSSTLCGLTCLRGTEHLTLDMKVDGRWSSVTVVNQERFTAGHTFQAAQFCPDHIVGCRVVHDRETDQADVVAPGCCSDEIGVVSGPAEHDEQGAAHVAASRGQ
jgi:hypothetical protein